MSDPENTMSIRCGFISLDLGQEKVPLSPECGVLGIPGDTGDD